ncbi:Sla1 Sh3 domain 3, partial [Syncephalis pseudoplumigaleata]
IALYDFEAQDEDELSIREADKIWVLNPSPNEEWWRCQITDAATGAQRTGVVPASYLE